jgi:hypothetical protein
MGAASAVTGFPQGEDVGDAGRTVTPALPRPSPGRLRSHLPSKYVSGSGRARRGQGIPSGAIASGS